MSDASTALETERQRELTEQENAERRERLKLRWVEIAGRYADCTLDNFAEHGSEIERQSQRRILEYLQSLKLGDSVRAGTNILFLGPVGSGKDHLLHSLAHRAFMGMSGHVTLRNGSILRRELRAAAVGDGDEEIVRKLSAVPLLCISDPVPTAGAGLSEYQADALYAIVDRRYHARLPTWITANLPAHGTRERGEAALSAPVWDRLKDGAIVIRCDWSSYRRSGEVIQ